MHLKEIYITLNHNETDIKLSFENAKKLYSELKNIFETNHTVENTDTNNKIVDKKAYMLYMNLFKDSLQKHLFNDEYFNKNIIYFSLMSYPIKNNNSIIEILFHKHCPYPLISVNLNMMDDFMSRIKTLDTKSELRPKTKERIIKLSKYNFDNLFIPLSNKILIVKKDNSRSLFGDHNPKNDAEFVYNYLKSIPTINTV